jgi:hypothetical protein
MAQVLFTDGREDLAVYLTRVPSVAHTDHSVRRQQMASLPALIGNHLLVYRPRNGVVHVFLLLSAAFAILHILFALTSTSCKNKTEQVGVEMLYIGVREPSGSHLIRDTGYPAWGFSSFLQIHPGKHPNYHFGQATTVHFQISSNSLVIYHPNIPHCDRLCGLVVRVLSYRYGGPGLIPGTTRKKK